MSRPLTIAINHTDGTPWEGGIVTDEQVYDVIADNVIYSAGSQTDTLDAQGEGSLTLRTPDSGTALHRFTLPNGNVYEVHVETGPSVDLLTLITVEGTQVAASDLQVLLDAESRLNPTAVTTTYQALATDTYLRCTGAPYTITLPAASDYVDGDILYVKNKSTSGNLTIAPHGTDTADGSAASRTILPTWAGGFVSDGISDWDVIGGVA